jgi:hypothetical protein
MRFDGWKLGCYEVWWLGGIYSPNHQYGHWWGLLSYGAPDSPVRQPRHPAVGFWPLELWHVRPPDSPVVHWTVTVHCLVRLLAPALTLRAQSRTVHCSCSFCRRPLAQLAVAPLAHRTVRWIIAEGLPEFPKLASWRESTLVHRTLSGGTPDSPVRQTRAAFGCFAPFFLNPFFELCIGLLWTFGTSRTYNLEQTS